jgi:lipopolysaccharide transport system ATP-binding protein
MKMIEVEHLWKEYRIPHEKRNTVFEALVGLLDTKKGYEEFTALKDIIFNVEKGEWLGVIGPNGSGKSTLLKIIANTIRPTKGRVTVNGRITSILELGVGFHPDLTAIENIRLYGAIMDFSDDAIEERVDGILDFAGLKPFADTKLKNFSSGMIVRLAFSTAIQTDPEILLLDEVLAVGDMDFQQKCFDVFERYRQEDKTVVFVTHDMIAVKRFCDRALLLNHGEQVAFGEIEEVIDEYVYGVGPEAAVPESVPVVEGANAVEPSVVEDVEVTERWGNKRVEITDVKFIDKFGNERTTFMSGDLMKIRLLYYALELVKDPIFGVAIYDAAGLQCFGTNTEIKNTPVESLDGVGHIDLIIEKIPMIEGKFLVTVAVHSKDNIPYDWLDKKYSFNVARSGRDIGLFDIPCKWKSDKT